jgi:predicted ABC-type ATPase
VNAASVDALELHPEGHHHPRRPKRGGQDDGGSGAASQDSRTARIRECRRDCQGLSPFNVDSVALKAGRLMLERIDELVGTETSFAFETTCAGRGHAKWLIRCQTKGWNVHILFLWLPDFRIAQARVVQRVSEGGHSIPPNVIERRYRAGIVNMRDLYLPLADSAAIYDNSNEARTLIAERERGNTLVVHDRPRWTLIEDWTLIEEVTA